MLIIRHTDMLIGATALDYNLQMVANNQNHLLIVLGQKKLKQ
jgi:predicted nucleic acid-binding protein